MRNLALFFAALADENRLRLLYLMKEGEICVCYLQAVLQTNQPKISRHLAYLRRAGLVEARRDGKWMHYRFKKLEAGREKILSETLHGLEKEPLIKTDRRRLDQITCCPARYGISPVEPKSNACKA
jgi:ArsR family transcriptional regulator